MSQPDFHGLVHVIVRVDDHLVEDTAIPLTEPVIERVEKRCRVGRHKLSITWVFDPAVRMPPSEEDAE